MTRVVIGIATFRRPRMLEQALRSIETLETKADVRVVVADNDAIRHEGFDVAERLAAAGYRFPISSILVRERGIPQARNSILEQAFNREDAAYLSFMDDDQTVEPAWLDAMLAMQAQTGADVVGSAVRADFEAEPPLWARTARAFQQPNLTPGPVELVHSTNGVLISARLTGLLPLPWFDPRQALTGGEDSHVFQRLRSHGVRFAYAGAAKIHEVYPVSRIKLRWVLSRAYRTGNADMRIALTLRPRGRVWSEALVKVTGALALAPFALLLTIGRPGRQVDTLCRIARAFGKIAALLGYDYDEYATIHGG